MIKTKIEFEKTYDKSKIEFEKTYDNLVSNQ